MWFQRERYPISDVLLWSGDIHNQQLSTMQILLWFLWSKSFSYFHIYISYITFCFLITGCERCLALRYRYTSLKVSVDIENPNSNEIIHSDVSLFPTIVFFGCCYTVLGYWQRTSPCREQNTDASTALSSAICVLIFYNVWIWIL